MWRRKEEPSPPLSPAPAQPISPAPLPREAPQVRPARPTSDAAYLGRSLLVKGTVSGQEDVFVDGRLEGSIQLLNSCVTIGPAARVEADIDATEIVVHGRVCGQLRGITRVEVGPSGVVEGTITSQRLQVHEGAVINGRVELNRKPVEPARTSAPDAAVAKPPGSLVATPAAVKDIV